LGLKKEFQKLIFLSTLRTYKGLGDVSREESEIFFENFEKKYQKTKKNRATETLNFGKFLQKLW
jgi:hypothetical protein